MSNPTRPPWHRRLKRSWPLFILILFLGVALIYNDRLHGRAAVDTEAPDFTLEDLAGGTVSLADYSGKVVFLNFWATWCPGCKEEMPAHQTFFERYGDRVVLLAINSRESVRRINTFQQGFADDGRPLTVPVLRDKDGRVSRKYLVRAMPESWFVDEEGIARVQWIGPMMFEQMQQGYEVTTGKSIDADGVGPLPNGTVLHSVAFRGEELIIGSDIGLITSRIGNGTVTATAVDQDARAEIDVLAAGYTRRAAVPEQPQRLFMATADGVSESRDGGASWRPTGIQTPVYDIAVAPGSPIRIYLATAQGILVSEDSGRTTRRMLSSPQRIVHAVAVNPAEPDTIVAGAPNGDIYMSTDRGTTWDYIPWASSGV